MLVRSLLAWSLLAAALPADERADFFEARIRPVLVEHCYACHSAEADEVEGGLRVDSREGWQVGGDNGPAIVPGRPEKSLLLTAIAGTDRDLEMPPDGRLPANVVADFRKWIADGAFDPRDEVPARVEAEAFDLVARRDRHWAWQPRRPFDPEATVDRFVDARLRAAGIEASPAADARTLVRRLHFTLIGLPPTPKDVARFVAAFEEDAEAAMRSEVDRLLASEHFGEHWARLWLDVVRWCETKGHVTDQPRPNAWRYRDWVIDAFDDDLPYDRFVIEQLAGDLLPEAEHRAGHRGETNVAPAATGMLFMHEMHFMAVDPVRQRWDEINAQVDVVGKAFLGLTTECARCHDHKFDAISQRDYYALAGFLHGTEQGRTRLAPWTPANENARKLDTDHRTYLENKRRQRRQAQAPKVGGAYFPISEELGIQSPGDSRTLAAKMQALELLDPAWGLWARSASEASAEAGSHDVPLLVRGNHERPGEPVRRRFLEAIDGPEPPTLGSRSGRMWLAGRIVDPDNPLTARVWVNRLWHHLLGRGIVSTPNNLGELGGRPTHPELLDHLAGRLVAEGWSTKAIIREIVLSRAWRRSSAPRPDLAEVDAENTLLARAHGRRLTAEQLRDGLLAVAGELDRTRFGPSVEIYVPPYATANKQSTVPVSGPLDGNGRRSLYLRVRRNFYDPFLLTFDFPDRGRSVGARPVTTVPGQALAMINGPLVHAIAAAWGERLAARNDAFDARLEHVWLRALSRPPRPDEVAGMRELATTLRTAGVTNEAALWKDIAHVAFNHPEFLALR